MKTLVLIRHAKSSWDDPELSDRERPLNKRGKKDAPFMGQLLKEKSVRPDAILSSPAKRALKTAKLIAEEIDYPKKKILVREEIYEHGFEALIDLIAGLDEGWNTVFMTGHNPEFTELANRLSGVNIDNVPTCGTVAIQFPFDNWRDSAKTKGSLAFFERPKRTLVDGVTE